MGLLCSKCGKRYSDDSPVWRCTCGGILDVEGTTQTATPYLNGIAGPAASSGVFTSQFTSGTQSVGGLTGHPEWRWHGPISEILVYNRALSESEHAALVHELDQKWIPEPSIVSLLVIGLASLAMLRRK